MLAACTSEPEDGQALRGDSGTAQGQQSQVGGHRPNQRLEAELLDKIQTKVLRFASLVFSHLYSFALGFLFLQTRATSYSFC
jgi:hypothetical protein